MFTKKEIKTGLVGQGKEKTVADMGYIINTMLHGTQYVLHATSFVIIDNASRYLSTFFNLVLHSRSGIALHNRPPTLEKGLLCISNLELII